MKQHKITTSLATLLLATSAATLPLSAIERPTPADQPKEKKAIQPAPLPIPEVAPKALRPYLGIMGDTISDAMSAQLGIAPGKGITLLFVEENSPAGKAGFLRHDIILKIAGLEINDENSLRQAILKQEPNEKVEIHYISKGKLKTKKVQLGSAPLVQPAQNNGPIIPRRNQHGIPQAAIPLEMLQNLPPEHRQQLQQLLQGNLNKLDFRNLDNLDIDRLQKHFEGFNQAPLHELNMNDLLQQGEHKQRMKMMDKEGSLTLETNGGNKQIQLHDATGKLLYKGPYNNEADKLKIPEHLRARVSKLKPGGIPKANILPKPRNLNRQNQLEELFKQFEGRNNAIPQLPKNRRPNNQQLQQRFEFNLGGNGLKQSSSKSLLDAKGNKYTTRENEDGKELEIHDRSGKLLFSGPYNSSGDKEMIPEEYRPGIEQLDSMKGLKNLKDGLKLEINPR